MNEQQWRGPIRKGVRVWAASPNADGSRFIYDKSGIVIDHLRSMDGRDSYKVRWEDGQEAWSLMNPNLSLFGPGEEP